MITKKILLILLLSSTFLTSQALAKETITVSETDTITTPFTSCENLHITNHSKIVGATTSRDLTLDTYHDIAGEYKAKNMYLTNYYDDLKTGDEDKSWTAKLTAKKAIAIKNMANDFFSADLTINAPRTTIENYGRTNNLIVKSVSDKKEYENGNIYRPLPNVSVSNYGELWHAIFTEKNGSNFEFINQKGGSIGGSITVNSGMDEMSNYGLVRSIYIKSKENPFTFNNYRGGVVERTNFDVEKGSKDVTINNELGAIFLAQISTKDQNFTFNNEARNTVTSFEAHDYEHIYGPIPHKGEYVPKYGDYDLTINNTRYGEIKANILSYYNNLTIHNDRPGAFLYGPFAEFDLNGYAKNFTINNNGYLKLTVDTIFEADLTETPNKSAEYLYDKNLVRLDNIGTYNGNIDVQYSQLMINNSKGVSPFDNLPDGQPGIINGNIIARDLLLSNTGTMTSSISVTDNMDVTNATTITGNGAVFKVSADATGVLNNAGALIATNNENALIIDDSLKDLSTSSIQSYTPACTSCGGNNDYDYPYDDLTINNTGYIGGNGALTHDYKAIDIKHAKVNNTNGGIISGSITAQNYYQDKNSTFETFIDTDAKKMNTITALDTIKIDKGATVSIITNNNVTNFDDGDTYLLVDGADSQSDLQSHLDNMVLKTDTPFANYELNQINNDGYLTFNKVDPLNFSQSTDIAASNHSKIATQSHRVYEMFTNRSPAPVQSANTGQSGGDEPVMTLFNTGTGTHQNSINFMPLMGYTAQDDKDGKSGYNSRYAGGIGYFEHSFAGHLKAGVGLAYLYANNRQKDDLKSESRVNSYRPFAYINYENGRFRADLAGGYAYHDVHDDRQYTSLGANYTAKGSYGSDEFSGYLNMGYKIYDNHNLTIEPIAGMYIAHVKTDAYTESGDGPMNMFVKADDLNSQKSMLGFKVKKEFNLDTTTLIPELHARWYHEFGDTNGSVSAYFLGQGELFNNSGVDSPEDLGDVAFRLTSLSSDNIDFFIETYYQFGTQFYNVGGGLGLEIKF